MTDRSVPIAVVGVSALFPGSVTTDGFWRDILAGRDLIEDVPASRWLIDDYYDPDPKAQDKTYARRGAFLETVDFDALGFGVPPSIAPATDSAQLLALIVAQRVLDDATRGQFQSMDRSRVSCILGVTSAQEILGSMVSRLQHPIWRKSLRDAGLPESKVNEAIERILSHYTPWQEASFPGLLGNVVAGRIANRFDLGGTNCVTDAACASTFSAMSMAVNELYLGQSDLVITGGVDTLNDIFMFMCFSKTPALSPTGDCRPFSDSADGTMLGEGLGMVALKRLEDAERDGDRIYAVVRAIGSSSDGRSKSVYAPVSEGQARALSRAYEIAGVSPRTIELVEAHGTGTKAGDAAEFEGLRQAFAPAAPDETQWCALGTVKSQIGHTKAAAGSAGFFKIVMALQHGVLPPTIKVDRPNPKLSIEASPFYLNTAARPWIRSSDHPRRAAVSSFGFGGTNFHIICEEYRGTGLAERFVTWPTQLVVASAATAEALADALDRLADAAASDADVAFVARDAQSRFDANGAHRAAFTAATMDELRTRATRAASRIRPGTAPFVLPDGTAYGTGPATGEVAFLFPGQGAQYVGMGGDVASAFECARDVWDTAADLVFDGRRLHEVVFPRPVFSDEDRAAQQAELTRTEWAQPAIGVASAATLRLLERLGLGATHAAGHSFGELTALHAASAYGLDDFLACARRRGELMAEAASTTAGAMSAIVADAERVRAFVAAEGLDVTVANDNAPDQVVISGSVEAIARAEAAAERAGLTARRLQVATAFHSPIVAGSVAPFRHALESIAFGTPGLNVWANATGDIYGQDDAELRDRLANQIASPVGFVAQIRAMYDAGVRTFIEVGPNTIQTGLVGRILADRPHVAVATDHRRKHGVTALFEALARLSAAGHAIAFDALWEGLREPVDPASIAKPRLALRVDGGNLDTPYPPKGGSAALPPPNPEIPAAPAAAMRVPSASPAAASPAPRAPTPPAPAAASPTPSARPPAPAAPATAPVAPVAHPRQQAAVPSPRPASSPPAATPGARAMSNPSHPNGAPPNAQAAWVQAWQEAQRQFADAHAAWQASMAQSHMAFLRAAEVSFVGLASMTGQGAPAGPPTMQAPALPAAPPTYAPPVYAAPAYAPPAAPAPVYAAPPAPAPTYAAPAPVYTPPAPAPAAPAPTAPAPTAPTYAAPAPVAAAPAPKAAAPAPVPAPAAASVDLMGLLLEVVADKTGYPADMLSMEMTLEADLGVDSIKRVEILSAMTEKAPGLPDVEAAEMATLNTLGEIVAYLQSKMGGAAAPAPAAPAAPAPAAPAAPAPAASTAGGVDLTALLLEVVADKTGYPADMLSMEMTLEADLGVDSIKRVEILSAMTEKAPGLPDVEAAEMASLQTLGEIVAHLQSKIGGAAGTKEVAEGHVNPKVGRFETLETPAPALGTSIFHFADGSTFSGRLVIVPDDRGVAELLAERLIARGIDAQVSHEADPGDAGVIYLGGLRQFASIDEATGTAREAFLAARAIARRAMTTPSIFVTVQDLGGRFGLRGCDPVRAWSGGLSGLAKTARQEWPVSHVRAIDIACEGLTADAIAERLSDELLAGGPEPEVGLPEAGVRMTPISVAAPAPSGAPIVGPSDVIVVSGGARGVTAATVIALARATRARFVLLGRSEVKDEPRWAAGLEDDASLKRAILDAARAEGRAITPPEVGRTAAAIRAGREIRATIDAVSAAGGYAIYAVADVNDAASIQRALERARTSLGPITGLMHGAGVLADKYIADKTPDLFDRVYDTKVGGLRALFEATREDALRCILLFSSVAARSGNAGQCDYAMANEVLNRVAQAERARRGPACIVRSIGWGPWEGGMVDASLKAKFDALGVPLIPLEQGGRMLVDELRGEGRTAEVVIGGEPRPTPLVADPSVAPKPLRMSIELDAERSPWLDDHQVAGVRVVPMALVAEWFTRAAAALSGRPGPARLTELKVLRGLRMTEAKARFTLEATPVAGPEERWSLRLLDGERPAYTATATVVPGTAPTAVEAPADLSPCEGPVYGGVLFHGPRLQAIVDAPQFGADGATARVRSAEALGWTPGTHFADVVLVDAALQLALLWMERATGRASLPMGAGMVTWHATTPVGPDARLVLRGRLQGRDAARLDVDLVDESGHRLASLRDVALVVRPDSGEGAAA